MYSIMCSSVLKYCMIGGGEGEEEIQSRASSVGARGSEG